MSISYSRLGFSAITFLAVFIGPTLGDTVDDVAETRENLLEVVKVREMLANEKRVWRGQKELMEGQLRLDQQALNILEAALAELRPRLESLQSESTRLELDLETSTQLVDFWTGKLEILKQRLSGMVARFPPGLRNELNAKLREALILDYREDSSKLKRVFDLCLEVISAANEYHQTIKLITEVHELSDGRRGEFNVVYLGLSGGYYYSENSGLAGTILWSGMDWKWVEDASLLEDLVVLGAMLSGQSPPRYLALPMAVNKGVAQ
jgi:hypothetical protein